MSEPLPVTLKRVHGRGARHRTPRGAYLSRVTGRQPGPITAQGATDGASACPSTRPQHKVVPLYWYLPLGPPSGQLSPSWRPAQGRRPQGPTEGRRPLRSNGKRAASPTGRPTEGERPFRVRVQRAALKAQLAASPTGRPTEGGRPLRSNTRWALTPGRVLSRLKTPPRWALAALRWASADHGRV